MSVQRSGDVESQTCQRRGERRLVGNVPAGEGIQGASDPDDHLGQQGCSGEGGRGEREEEEER